jgi:ubiquinone/menaquinone biosynthesis C-methylase UbiE
MPDVLNLRATFDSAARTYDAIRPGYPAALVEDVIQLSEIPPGGRVLEVGCGTGQATLAFARRGYAMHCLDIGAEMLALARHNLREYPRVGFEQRAFEDWSPPAEGFDLLISATAFHWVPKETRLGLAARALRPGGALAVFFNEHPRQPGFFEESQSIYQRVVGAPAERLPLDQIIAARAAEIDASGLFSPVLARTYAWQRRYTTQEYMRLLGTYSDILALDEARRGALLDGLADLMDTRYGGQVEKEYLAVLYLARKPAA